VSENGENTIKGNKDTVVERVIDRIVIACGTVSAIALLALMCLFFVDVFCRYLFNAPILGSVELVEFMMAVVISFALAYGQYLKRHVFVEIFYQKIKGRAKAVVDIIIAGLCILIYFLISLTAFQQTQYLFISKMTSGVLLIPVWPFRLALGIGAFIFCLAVVRDVFGYARDFKNRAQDEEKEIGIEDLDLNW